MSFGAVKNEEWGAVGTMTYWAGAAPGHPKMRNRADQKLMRSTVPAKRARRPAL